MPVVYVQRIFEKLKIFFNTLHNENIIFINHDRYILGKVSCEVKIKHVRNNRHLLSL